MYNLLNRKVLVTGASRGLGAAIAKAFAVEGCDLAITYLGSKDRAEAVADGIKTSTGRRTAILQGVSVFIRWNETLIRQFTDAFTKGSVTCSTMQKDCR